MNNRPLISVIIPTYNYGCFIPDALDAIMTQTYTNWEVLVIDDGSGDNTKQVVEEYAARDSRIHYIWQKNAGPSAARNKGIELMKGEYVQFLDPDDLFEKRKFEVQLNVFHNNPEADIVYSKLRYFTERPFDPDDRKYSFWGVEKEWMPLYQGRGLTFLPKALMGNFTHFSGMLFHKRIIEKAGRFDEINNAPSDYTYILQCVIKDGFFVFDDTPETYGLIRWHRNSLSRNQDRMNRDEINARRWLAPMFKDNIEATEVNENAIKVASLQIKGSWKRIFLAGGPFDFIKKVLRVIGLEKLAKKIFYK